MMHYEPPIDHTPIKPAEQRKRERRYIQRIKLALARYEAWKAQRK